MSKLFRDFIRLLCAYLWIGICRINTSWEEITLDAIRIADTYLDMVLLGKPCTGVKRLALPEYTSNGIVWMLVRIPVQLMGSLDNGTIQLAN